MASHLVARCIKEKRAIVWTKVGMVIECLCILTQIKPIGAETAMIAYRLKGEKCSKQQQRRRHHDRPASGRQGLHCSQNYYSTTIS